MASLDSQYDKYKLPANNAARQNINGHNHIEVSNACIYNQTIKDENSFFVKPDAAYDIIYGMNQTMGISCRPFTDLTPSFFQKDIFNYDLIFLLTHGEYDSKHNLHWLYTSEELLCAEKENWQSNIAAATALITWVLIDTVKVGKPTMLGAITGGVAGLVAITPAAGFVDVPAAIIIGFITAFVSYFAIYYLKAKFGYDDTLDVFGVHGLSGAWGAIATGIFASPAINGAAGLLFGNPSQLTIQVISVVVTAVYAFVVSIILAKILDKTIGIRVEEKEEIGGLDANLHNESGYRL